VFKINNLVIYDYRAKEIPVEAVDAG